MYKAKYKNTKNCFTIKLSKINDEGPLKRNTIYLETYI